MEVWTGGTGFELISRIVDFEPDFDGGAALIECRADERDFGGCWRVEAGNRDSSFAAYGELLSLDPGLCEPLR